jgi:hypothetical protein
MLHPDPDPLVRGTNPDPRIRTKMSRIPNTALCLPSSLKCILQCHVIEIMESD